jgi:hypothetical protein
MLKPVRTEAAMTPSKACGEPSRSGDEHRRVGIIDEPARHQ